MNRIERSEKKYKELFGDLQSPMLESDPDFVNIMNRFIYGDIYAHEGLDDKTRGLINLVIYTTNQTLTQLGDQVEAALNVGLTPVEIKEAVYHCAPYAGFPKALSAIQVVNDVFKFKNIPMPLTSQTRAGEEERFDKGLGVRVGMSGDIAAKSYDNAPVGQKHIQEYLNAFCFGDFFTRGGIDVRGRELLTFCILSAQGGCETQIKGHIRNNVSAGNDKKTLIAAITHCLPLIGFPRMLNALNCINEILPN